MATQPIPPKLDWQQLDTYKTPMEIAWQFDYAIDIEKLRNLYSKAKQNQWDAERHLDWSVEIDPSKPIVGEDLQPVFSRLRQRPHHPAGGRLHDGLAGDHQGCREEQLKRNVGFHGLFLSDDSLNHMPMHVRQTHVAAAEAEGGLGMFQAKQMEHRGVQVVHLAFVRHHLVA